MDERWQLPNELLAEAPEGETKAFVPVLRWRCWAEAWESRWASSGRIKIADWIVLVLLCLAAVHCARSIFVVNVSVLDLMRYEEGRERMPFQGRVAMMPVLRWAHDNRKLGQITDHLNRRNAGRQLQLTAEPYSPEKVVCIAIGTIATLAILAVAIAVGFRRMRPLWWLPGALFLVMLYITNASRYTAQFWYPYDLPHMALFSIAAVCILEGLPLPAFLLFLLDIPVRETAIFLVPMMIAFGVAEKKRWTIALAVVMTCIWSVPHVAIAHRFAANPSAPSLPGKAIAESFTNPALWPQVASAFGFLLIPFCMGIWYLTRREQIFVIGAIPSFLGAVVFGVWYETRIFNELLLPLAILLSLQIYRWIGAMALKNVYPLEASAATNDALST